MKVFEALREAKLPLLVHCFSPHEHSSRTRRWHRGAGEVVHAGDLSIRVLGSGHQVIVLLHGLTGSQAYFGRAFDRLAGHATLVVPDLLGFGDSMRDDDAADTRFSLERHCRAIYESLAALHLEQRPILLVGHSMGAAIALNLAATSELDIRRVIAFGAPLYRTNREANEHVHNMGWFEALLTHRRFAQMLCNWMCRHRPLASILAITANPRLPTRISRDAVRHTWQSYIQSFESVVTSPTWERAIEEIAYRNIAVDLVYGDSDRVPVRGRAQQLERHFPMLSAVQRPGRHDLPLADPQWCARFVEERVEHKILVVTHIAETNTRL